jgi:putative oxidoreductase
MGWASPLRLAALAIVGELAGALMLIVGGLARVGALLIATIMLVAIAAVHWPYGFFMNWFGRQTGEGFEYHLLALALAAVVLLQGAGPFSIDQAAGR